MRSTGIVGLVVLKGSFLSTGGGAGGQEKEGGLRESRAGKREGEKSGDKGRREVQNRGWCGGGERERETKEENALALLLIFLKMLIF